MVLHFAVVAIADVWEYLQFPAQLLALVMLIMGIAMGTQFIAKLGLLATQMRAEALALLALMLHALAVHAKPIKSGQE
jgi:hypothetical protein